MNAGRKLVAQRRKPRSPLAALLRRMGHKVKPSKKRYSRKGRSQDRPFDVLCIRVFPSAAVRYPVDVA